MLPRRRSLPGLGLRCNRLPSQTQPCSLLLLLPRARSTLLPPQRSRRTLLLRRCFCLHPLLLRCRRSLLLLRLLRCFCLLPLLLRCRRFLLLLLLLDLRSLLLLLLLRCCLLPPLLLRCRLIPSLRQCCSLLLLLLLLLTSLPRRRCRPSGGPPCCSRKHGCSSPADLHSHLLWCHSPCCGSCCCRQPSGRKRAQSSGDLGACGTGRSSAAACGAALRASAGSAWAECGRCVEGPARADPCPPTSAAGGTDGSPCTAAAHPKPRLTASSPPALPSPGCSPAAASGPAALPGLCRLAVLRGTASAAWLADRTAPDEVNCLPAFGRDAASKLLSCSSREGGRQGACGLTHEKRPCSQHRGKGNRRAWLSTASGAVGGVAHAGEPAQSADVSRPAVDIRAAARSGSLLIASGVAKGEGLPGGAGPPAERQLRQPLQVLPQQLPQQQVSCAHPSCCRPRRWLQLEAGASWHHGAAPHKTLGSEAGAVAAIPPVAPPPKAAAPAGAGAAVGAIGAWVCSQAGTLRGLRRGRGGKQQGQQRKRVGKAERLRAGRQGRCPLLGAPACHPPCAPARPLVRWPLTQHAAQRDRMLPSVGLGETINCFVFLFEVPTGYACACTVRHSRPAAFRTIQLFFFPSALLSGRSRASSSTAVSSSCSRQAAAATCETRKTRQRSGILSASTGAGTRQAHAADCPQTGTGGQAGRQAKAARLRLQLPSTEVVSPGAGTDAALFAPAP